MEPLVRVSYLDPCSEFTLGDLEVPEMATIVGWHVEARWEGWMTLAVEHLPTGFRAFHHIPESVIVSVEELDPPLAPVSTIGMTF